MEANGNSSIEVYRNLQGFIAILTSAACEWVLIFLLLIDAVLSYLLKKFADYCNLQRPCILCSRLDHVIGNENNTELYQNLLCSKHISDLSSLISCRNHGKLADGRGMCEDCLFSFTTKNKANAEMHRVLEAKLEADIGGSGFQSSFLNMDSLPGFIVTKRCSCCNKPWNTRQSANKLLQLKSSENVSRVSDLEHASIDKHKEVLKSTSISAGPSTKIDWVVNDTTVINAKNSDIFDVCENESSCVIEPIMKEPHAVDKKSKPLSLRNSLGQECSFSSKNTSPGRDAQDDEVQITDASNSNEIQMLRKSVSVESGLESLDRSNVTEIEGENIVDRLQRQVEHDKRRMAVLFKELEAERNASEIATNQAMAMITRLQEEKAALHMEALQYLRMMEEQAEYDVEALEKANDLLAEKEKEIQDMEAELEFYRLNFPDEIKSENFHGGYDMKSKNDAETPTVVCRDNISIPCNSITTDIKACGKTFAAKTPCLEFEDERLYISQHLQCLEKKLCQIFRNGTFSNMANGDHSKKLADDGHKGIGSRQKEEILLNNHIEEYLHDCNGSTTSPEDGSASDDDDCYCLSSNGNNHFDSHSQTNCVHQSRIDLVALGNEISDLNDRLEALETDNDFLEHMLNSIQHGNEGLQFVQEVAHQLQELRKTWIGLRSQSVP